jgi:hypothetical protein
VVILQQVTLQAQAPLLSSETPENASPQNVFHNFDPEKGQCPKKKSDIRVTYNNKSYAI